METATITKTMLKNLKRIIKVPFKELQVSSNLSFIIFQIGQEPYYIKVIS